MESIWQQQQTKSEGDFSTRYADLERAHEISLKALKHKLQQTMNREREEHKAEVELLTETFQKREMLNNSRLQKSYDEALRDVHDLKQLVKVFFLF